MKRRKKLKKRNPNNHAPAKNVGHSGKAKASLRAFNYTIDYIANDIARARLPMDIDRRLFLWLLGHYNISSTTTRELKR